MKETKQVKGWMRYIWIGFGFIAFGLGCIGIFLPILPTVPFFLLTIFCFAKGSERLHRWFLGTSMYKKHVQPFSEKKAMTLRSKLTIIGTVSIMMGASYYFMSSVLIGRIMLAIVWVAHVIYLLFFVKTEKKTESAV